MKVWYGIHSHIVFAFGPPRFREGSLDRILDGDWVRAYFRLDAQNSLGVAQASIPWLPQVSCEETELLIPLGCGAFYGG
jgi:hypothetical protein